MQTLNERNLMNVIKNKAIYRVRERERLDDILSIQYIK